MLSLAVIGLVKVEIYSFLLVTWLITKCVRYYKVRQLLQSKTEHSWQKVRNELSRHQNKPVTVEEIDHINRRFYCRLQTLVENFSDDIKSYSHSGDLFCLLLKLLHCYFEENKLFILCSLGNLSKYLEPLFSRTPINSCQIKNQEAPIWRSSSYLGTYWGKNLSLKLFFFFIKIFSIWYNSELLTF